MTGYKNILPIYGAISGDVIGSRFEHWKDKLLNYSGYSLLGHKNRVTDDTVLTVAVAEALLRDDLTPRRIAHYMRKWGRRYPNAGFGSATKKWLYSKDPKPYNSNRNGAAMRVSPCGVVATSLDEALILSKKTAEVSHNTVEGIKGAQAISSSIFLARNGASKDEIRSFIKTEFNYDLSQTVADIKSNWSGFSCKAIDTVPQSIVAFLESTDVEGAIRYAISMGSDADTMADMAGAIAAAFYGEIPFINDILEFVPYRMKRVLNELDKKLSNEPFDPLIDRNKK